jgi:hypothetical protein
MRSQHNLTILTVSKPVESSLRIGGKLRRGGDIILLVTCKKDYIHYRSEKGRYPCMSLHVTKRFHFFNSPLPSSLGLLSSLSFRYLVLLINPLEWLCALEEGICLMSFSTQTFVRWALTKKFVLHFSFHFLVYT